MKLFLLLLLLVSRKIYCQKLSLIGSHFVPPELEYKAFIHAKDLEENSSVNVSIEGMKSEYIKRFDSLSTFSDEIKFQVEDSSKIEFELKISYKDSNNLTTREKTTKLINLSQLPLIFIQTSKTIYKSTDHDRFQIFALNRKLLPFNESHVKQMCVTIFDAQNVEVDKYENATLDKFGTFEGIFKFNQSQNFGRWKIQTEINGKKRMKFFFVQKNSDKSTLQIDVMTKTEISKYDDIILNFKVKHPTKQYFTGSLAIIVSAYSLDTNAVIFENKEMISNFTYFKVLRTKKDLGITIPSSDFLIKLEIRIEDHFTADSATVKKDVILRQSAKRKITLIGKNYFQPGYKFSAKAKIRTFDDKPDNSLNDLKLKIEYTTSSNKTHTDSKSFSLNNGGVIFHLDTYENTETIRLNFYFDGAILNKVIKRLPGPNEYIGASFAKPKSHEKNSFRVTLKTTSIFNSLQVLVVGPYGVVFHEKYPKAINKDIYDLTVNITEEMKPRSTFLVYDINNDGDIKYNTLPLNFDIAPQNFLNVKSINSAYAEQEIDIFLDTNEGSKIYLTAAEENPGSTNTLLLNDVYDELLSYKDLNFCKDFSHEFDESSLFILEPLSMDISENHLLCSDFEDRFNNLRTETSHTESQENSYIPQIWFNSVENYNGKKLLKKLPKSLAEWKINGISIHPEKGLAVLSNALEISVKKDIIVDVEPTVNSDNFDKISFNVINLNANDIYANITISVINGFLLDSSSKCEIKTESVCRYGVELPGYTNPDRNTIFVQPKGKNSTTVVIAANSKDFCDEAKIILNYQEIENSFTEKQINNIKTQKRLGATMLNLDKSHTLQNIVNLYAEADYNCANVDIYGNLLDPVIGKFDHIFTPLNYDELKIDKFLTSVISYKFFKKNNDTEHDLAEKERIALKEEIQEILQTSLKIQEPKSTDIRLMSYAIQALIEAERIQYNINKTLVNEAALIIMNHQNPDGSFPYEGNASYRADIGSSKAQIYIQTALLFSIFAKDNDLKNNFEHNLQKSYTFLTSIEAKYLNNDYEKVLSAYSISLMKDANVVKSLLNELEYNYKKNSPLLKHKSIFCEIVSYLILTKISIHEDPVEEIEWLISNRNSDGGFYSPYTTVIALQALYEYMVFKDSFQTDLKIHVNANTEIINERKYHKRLQVYTKLINIASTGKGLAYASFSYDEVIGTSKERIFHINPGCKKTKDNKYKIEINLEKCSLQTLINFMIIEIQIPLEFALDQKSIDDKKFTSYTKKNLLIVSGKQIECEKNSTKNKHIANLVLIKNDSKKDSKVPVIITVYDYYRQNLKDYISYDLNECKKTKFFI